MFDYTDLTADAVTRGIDAAIEEATTLLNQVVDPMTEPTFENTMLKLDEIGDITNTANARYGFMGYVHPDEEVRNAALAGQQTLQGFGVELIYRDDLYEAVRRYSTTDEAAALEGERRRALEHGLRDFRRAGHELEPEQREELKRRAQRMVELSVKFQSNIDNSPNQLLVDRDDLDGLPESYIESLETDVESGKLVVTMAYPHVIPFLENARRRDLRQQLSYLFNTRAVDSNRPLIEEAIRLRDESARILGYESWAHFVLEDRMARDPKTVAEFYDDLLPELTRLGEREVAAATELATDDLGDQPLQPWDWSFYDTMRRKKDYGVDQYEIAEYLSFENVIDGLFDLVQETFGLSFERLDEARAWHEDVGLYAMRDAATDELVAHFYLDVFPRPGKFSHAAMFTLAQGRRLRDGSYQNPVCAMVANFTKPTGGKPSLMQHSEMETFFHEFGHVLHQNLGRTELGGFSGTNVERDFVEAPSQIMQHWVWRSDVLKRFARHYETGEPIPNDLVDRLVAARRLNKGIFQLRQASYGILDARIHASGSEKDLDRISREAASVTLLPFHEGTFALASFGHLMGGYDAAYYGYMWSEVYGDDMFSRFELEGVTNPAVGRAYREEILEKGGSVDASEMLVSFLGREPDNSAFLRKIGVAGTDSSVPVV